MTIDDVGGLIVGLLVVAVIWRLIDFVISQNPFPKTEDTPEEITDDSK